jgi:ATP-dependent exoDNAse (exonuclease V) beta subunit
MTVIEIAVPDQEARRRIRAALDDTLFVEAGAGSGKTAALVGRVVALVASGEHLEHIAAITFTEKAATELRDRVRAELEDASLHPDLDPAVRERCRAAVDEVDTAAIGTLHAFAQRLLREHPVEAGLPPAVEVMDEIESQVAFEERWHDFTEQLLADPGLERTLLLAFALHVDFDHLADIAVAFGDNWDLLATHVPLDMPDPPRLDCSVMVRHAREIARRRSRCSEPEDRLHLWLDELEAWCGRVDAADDELVLVDELLAAPEVKKYGAKRNWNGVDLDELRSDTATVAAAAAELRAPFQAACLRRLAGVIAKFTLDCARERRERGRLEFHDLLVLARELLTRNAGVRVAVHDRYRRILLDEFQDTDPIQIDLAVRIAAAPDAEAARWQDLEPESGRLFVVGDPKQSIYRFRRADIGLFLDARDQLAGGHPELLHANFRTTEPVLAWVNDVFDRLIVATEKAQPEYQALAATRTAPADAGPAVTVLGVGVHTDGPKAETMRDREAAEVAAAVTTVVRDGWLVADTDTGARDTWRPARYGDITVLVPTRTSLPLLEQALDAAGVPYRAESSSLVYVTSEIRALMLAVRAVDDPSDGLAVVSALRSSLFGCSDRDLFEWKQRRGGAWNPMASLPEREPGDDPVHEAMSLLAELVADRSWMAPSVLLARLVERRRVLELGVVSGRPRDLWRRVRFLIDQARAWSEAGGTGLRAYLEWARRQSLDGARAAEVVLPELDEDAVHIMTIHAAKGLEFAVTVVSGMTTEPRNRRGGARVIWTPTGCEVFAGKDVRTERYDDAKELDEQLDHHERVRLLYVACTRARDHLIVSLHRKKDFGGDEPEDATSAALLAWASDGAAHTVLEPSEAESSAPEKRGSPVWAWADYARWEGEREARLHQASVISTVAATRLAQFGTSPDPGLAKDQRDLELPPWQKGRYGTAVGRAVHAVLQTIDLLTGRGLEEAAAAQAAAEGVIGREAIVAALARSALNAPVVRQAARLPNWREVFVAAPIGDRLLEGYIDLLYRTVEGLVVVDYKTDHVPDDETLQARFVHYRRQGAAYAAALERVTGERVARCVFVFCSRAAARQVEVDDVRGAIAEIEATVADGTSFVP